MATQTQNAGTGADDASIGTVTWSNPGNITASDNTYATNVDAGYTEIRHYQIRMVKGGTIQGNTVTDGTQLHTVDTEITWGTTSDLWGLTWTADDINATNFGFVWSVQEAGGGIISHYLKGTNFGFAIPTGATINGIEVTVEQKKDDAADTAYADLFKITVTYTVTGPANLKTVNDLAKASVKTINGLAIASVKTKNDLA